MRQSSHHRLAHTPPLSSSLLSELDRRHGKPAVENEPITLLKPFGVMVGAISTESQMDSGGGWGLVGPSCIGYDNVCCCLVGHRFGASRLSPQFILLLTETSVSGETIIPLNENKQQDPTMSKLDVFFCN
jgi:hypothetical protein